MTHGEEEECVCGECCVAVCKCCIYSGHYNLTAYDGRTVLGERNCVNLAYLQNISGRKALSISQGEVSVTTMLRKGEFCNE